jgi:hypothetical protein
MRYLQEDDDTLCCCDERQVSLELTVRNAVILRVPRLIPCPSV